jgi:hypothetical protein
MMIRLDVSERFFKHDRILILEGMSDRAPSRYLCCKTTAIQIQMQQPRSESVLSVMAKTSENYFTTANFFVPTKSPA